MRSHRRGGDPILRFWEKVSRQDDDSACWLWKCQLQGDGYGVLKVGGIYLKAHRFAYERLREPIPTGLEIDHLCRNRACVNPSHLEAVTHTENLRRGEIGIQNRRKTHCVRGHAFTSENTRIAKNGGRICKTCMRLHQKNFKRKHAATIH